MKENKDKNKEFLSTIL